MELDTALWQRRSVRDYDGRPVDPSILHHLIDAAIQAPSAVNEQPWTFTVVRDQAALARLSREAKAHTLARIQTDGSAGAHSDRFQKLLSDPTFHIFYQAPVLIVISANAPGSWVTEDCAMAAQNLMLAAFCSSLGSCWIGFAQRYLNTPEGKQTLGVPDAWVPVAPIIVGYPRTVPAPVPRKPPTIRWVD
jgi:nitroreductase